MDNRIETEYVIKIEEALKSFKAVDERLGTIEDLTNRAGNNQSFATLGKTVNQYNRVLADGSKIYRQVESNAKAYKSEIERLTKAEKELIKTQIEFKNGADYDEAEQNLIQVRKRIEEIKAGLDKTGDSVKKTGGGFIDFAKKAGVAIVGFFAVDKLINIEGQIIDATKQYEKYFAVLKNGFGDENKATQSLELIYEFASATPFQVNEITESFIKLSNRGFTPTRQELVKLGDLAASQGKSFDQLTEAILDATSGEFERLKEFGIRAKTVGDIVTLSFKGQEVSVNKFNEGALKDAVLGFGALKGVAGAMGAVSQTLEGQISNLGDSYDQLLVSLGKSQGFLSTVVGLFKSMLDGVKAFIDVPIEQKLKEENAELNVLAKSLILANENEAVKSKLITEISQKYPSFLNLLEKETDNIFAIENALKLVNEQYRIKIRLAGQDVLAKRNAEALADVYEVQADAYGKAEKALEKFGIKASEFQRKSKAEQEKIIQDIKNKTKDTEIVGGGFGGTRIESGKKEQAISPFRQLQRLAEEQNKLEQKGIDIQEKKVSLANDEVTVRNEAIERMKQENIQLSKNLISRKEFDKLSKQDYLLPDEQVKSDNFKKFNANKEQITTFGKQGETPKPSKPSRATTTAGTTVDNPKVEDLSKELEQLKKAETKYQDDLSKIRLESDNVRLSMLDKESKKYLEAKLAYDQKLIDTEESKYKELYQIQLENEILTAELEKRKGEKILESELKTLQENAKLEAERISNDPADARNFKNTASTAPQKAIIDSKREYATFQYFEGLEKIEEKGIKEQQERLDLQNSLLGEGIEKQTQTINERYKRLIEKYKENQEIVKQLESKRNLELAEANFESQNKDVETSKEAKKNVVESRVRPSGINQIDFEIQQKQDLLGIDIRFYKSKIELLEKYLESESYLKSVANGQISAEKKKANEAQLEELRKTFGSAITQTENFTAESLLKVRNHSGWDVIGDIYKKISGNVLKLAEDPTVDQAIKDSISSSMQSLQDSFNIVMQMQIDNSANRIKVLDDEIGIRENKLNEEREKYKQGLANNYEAEKSNLDKKKEERDKEVEHRKKLQKQQAAIDSITIIGQNAVTVAYLISASAKAFDAHVKIPFVGIALGLAAVATIIATVAGVTAKAKQASRLRYGGKYGKIRGNLHEVDNGIEIGNTGVFVEGGEYINRREVVEKSPKFFDAVNDGSFDKLDVMNQRRLLKPFGLKLTESRNDDSRINADNLKTYKTAKEKQSMTDYHYKKMALHMGAVAENTNRIPEHQIVSDSDGNIFKFDPKGKLIEKMEKQ